AADWLRRAHLARCRTHPRDAQPPDRAASRSPGEAVRGIRLAVYRPRPVRPYGHHPAAGRSLRDWATCRHFTKFAITQHHAHPTLDRTTGYCWTDFRL